MSTFYSNNFLHNVPLKKPPPKKTAAAATTTTRTKAAAPASRQKIHLRKRGRRRLPVVHLGGGENPRRHQLRGFSLTRLFRRTRLKWLRMSFFNRLKKYYKKLVKDIIEASASVEAYQHRVFMETSLASVPGVSFSSFHGGSTLRSPKSIFIL